MAQPGCLELLGDSDHLDCVLTHSLVAGFEALYQLFLVLVWLRMSIGCAKTQPERLITSRT